MFSPLTFFFLLISFARYPAPANSIIAFLDPSVYQNTQRDEKNKHNYIKYVGNCSDNRMNYRNVVAFLGRVDKSVRLQCLLLVLTCITYEYLSPSNWTLSLCL